MTIPRDEGTYDPNNEDDEPIVQLVVPETFISKVTDKDEVECVPELGID